MHFQIVEEEESGFRCSLSTITKAIGRIFFILILNKCHKKSPFILFIQPSSIDENNGLAMLKPIDEWTETPKKTMEFHDTLYCLTLLEEGCIDRVSFSTTILKR